MARSPPCPRSKRPRTTVFSSLTFERISLNGLVYWSLPGWGRSRNRSRGGRVAQQGHRRRIVNVLVRAAVELRCYNRNPSTMDLFLEALGKVSVESPLRTKPAGRRIAVGTSLASALRDPREETGGAVQRPRDIPAPLWSALHGKVWHATSPKGLEGIVRDGYVAVASDRHNAFAHHMNLVSLFDLGPTAFNQRDAFGMTASDHMRGWLDGRWWPDQSRVAVWLEADVDKMGMNYRSAAVLSPLAETNAFVCKKQTSGRPRRSLTRFIHGLEAGHCGSLPVALLRGAVIIDCATRAILDRRVRVDEWLVGCVRDWIEGRNR